MKQLVPSKIMYWEFVIYYYYFKWSIFTTIWYLGFLQAPVAPQLPPYQVDGRPPMFGCILPVKWNDFLLEYHQSHCPCQKCHCQHHDMRIGGNSGLPEVHLLLTAWIIVVHTHAVCIPFIHWLFSACIRIPYLKQQVTDFDPPHQSHTNIFLILCGSSIPQLFTKIVRLSLLLHQERMIITSTIQKPFIALITINSCHSWYSQELHNLWDFLSWGLQGIVAFLN